jgi:nucleoside-diphosphate-sugar epimerase
MVLVTGGSGLLGTELIKQLLEQGNDVRAIYNNTPLQAFNRNPFSNFMQYYWTQPL